MAESMAQFVARRMRETSRFGREAEAVAHEAYRRAIRAGQDLRLPTSRDVMDYGAKLLKQREPGGAKPPASRPIARTAPDTSSASAPKAAAPRSNPVVRKLAGDTAEFAGNIVGVGRGAVHTGKGLWDGAVFTGRLIGGDRETWDHVVDAGGAAIDYGRRAVADPEMVVRDVKAKAHQMRTELDPRATPEAATAGEELRRRFEIGQNQGEFVFDVGSLVVGGPAAKTVGRLATAVKPATAEKYVAQGFSPAAAAHLAEPYPWLGHHYVANRFDLPLSRSYRDGPYNMLKPSGITRGDFYELHYRVDPKFHGTGVRGEPWSGKALGLEKYDRAGRLWYGAPGPLKARAGGLSAAVGGAAYDQSDEDDAWW